MIIIGNMFLMIVLLFLQIFIYSMVKYYVSCFDENNKINLSLVLYNNKEPVGVMRLIVRKDENQE